MRDASAEGGPTPLRTDITSGTLWVGAGRVVSVALGLAITIVAERNLGGADFGRFIFVFTVTTITGLATQVGLHQTVLREVGAAPDANTRGAVVRAARRVWAASQLAWVAIAVAAVLAVEALGITIGASTAATVFALVGLTAGRSYEVVVGEAFRGIRDYRGASLLGGNVTYALSVAVLTAMWVLVPDASLGDLLVAVGATGSVAAVVAEIAYRRAKAFPLGVADPSWTARRMVVLAWPIAVSSTTTVVLSQVDVLIVATAATAFEVGVYGVAARLVLLVTMPLGMLNLVVAPIIAELNARGEQRRMERIVQVTATVAALPAIAVLAVFTFVPGTVLGTIYGPEFRAGGLILAILSVGRMVNAWTGACGIALLMTGRQRLHMGITVATGAVRVGLSLWLVQVVGVTAVAVATSAESAVTNILLWEAARRKIGIRTQASMIRTVRVLREDPELVRGVLRRIPVVGRRV